MANRLADYIRKVIEQAHTSEEKPAGDFYLQAWTVDDKSIIVLASSPYLRVLRKVYYRLQNNIYQNFKLKWVDVQHLVSTSGNPKNQEHSAGLSLWDMATTGFTIGSLHIPVFGQAFYIDIDRFKQDYLSYLPPILQNHHTSDAYQESVEKFDGMIESTGGEEYYYYDSNYPHDTDLYQLARQACLAATGFAPPALNIKEVYTQIPENVRKIRLH